MNNTKYLRFLLGDEHYCVSIAWVNEVLGMTNITQVPKMPAFVKGVINVRGRIIPVIDLRLKFAMPSAEYTDKTCIVVLTFEDNGKNHTVGVIVDHVVDIVRLAEEDIKLPPKFYNGQELAFILGLAKVDEALVWVLRFDRILTSDEVIVMEKIKQGV